MKQKLLLLFCSLLVSIAAFAQPANNNCNQAQSLGTLPTPAACPSGNGNPVSVTGTTVGATGPNPYTYLLGCQPAGNQAAPALDVWYSFTATGNVLNINMSGTLASPNVALWTGNCNNLTGVDCAIGANNGNLSVTFEPVTPGTTYYLQVSGNTAVSTGTFTLTVDNDNDCTDCLQTSTLSVSPAPVNGTYPPGTTVTFCYTITSWTQVSANWLHGITPTFGCGWNLSTLNGTTAPNAGNGYVWDWGNGPIGPGWWCDADPVGPQGPDGNFTNNYGDPAISGTGNWQFCWSIQTATTCACPNLNMSINTTSDGETGNWTSIACQNDAVYQFSASMSCCSISATGTNLTCNGVNTGTATATQLTGTGPYSYSWSPTGGTSTNATNLPAGTYTITSTDNNGCVSTATVLITQPPAISLTPTQTNVTCNGVCNGSASVVASGGTGTYTYTWSPAPGGGQGTATATGLCAATYTVTVSSPAGCTRTQTFSITQPPVITATQTQTNVTCASLCNGAASVVASGGTGTYTYNWSPAPGGGQGTANATGLCVGTYTCTISSPAGCTITRTFSITAPPAITLTPTQTNVTCNGVCNGSASVTATGGTGTYTYVWAPGGQTTAGITGQCAGNYTVTVSSPAGCTATQTYNITQPPAITITPTQTNVTCFGSCNGAATGVATGGTGTYTYSWAPAPGGGQGTANATGLCAGTYTLTVSSPAGCTRTQIYTITSPPAITLTPTQTNVTCFGSCNGSASVTATGGTGTYTYVWAPGGQTTAGITAQCAGNYTVTVSSPAGCTATQTYAITQPPALTLTPTQTNVTCFGSCNGSASVTATGGTGTYTYAWAPGGQTTAGITGQCAGNYTVTVSSPAGCTATQTYNITAPPAITLTPTQTNVTCFGSCNGSASVTATGGTGTYTYVWAPGGQTTAGITGQCAGNYTVTVSSPAGCTAIQTYSITSPPAITLTPTQTNILCNGQCTGSASVTATGGTGTYTYLWAPSGGTGASATSLCAGAYTVTVTSGPVGCTATQTFNITQVPAITATQSQTNVLCNGSCNGQASVTASGGTGTYTYLWSPSGGTGSTATGLCAGSYTCTITSGPAGCTITQTFNITQPTALSATTSFTQASCNMSNGAASVSVSGGVGPYSYSWSPLGGTGSSVTGRPAGTYTVTYTDANGCTGTATVTIPNAAAPTATITATTNVSCFGGNNGSATVAASGGTTPYTYAWSPLGGTGATGTNLTAQNYTVTVTDANGCTVQATVAITQPTAITVTASMTPVTCNGGNTGTATATPAGGVSPYTYAWSPSAQTTATATNLTAQTYTVTITDANGCTSTASVTVTQPTVVTTTVSMTPVLCNGGTNGTATATPSGGVGPYTYSWNPSAQTTATATNLSSQSYTVTVTDANGCTTTASVSITQPTALAATTSFTQATCNMSNGAASVSVSGGVGPYTYSWSPLGGTGSSVTGRPAGTYTVIYTDANGCTGTATVTIPNAASPTVTITGTTNVSCFGGNNGSATTSTSGGTSPYTYAWSPIGGTGSTGTNLTAQSYTVTVTDANGCSTTATVTITQPPAFTASASMTPVTCNGGSTGTATGTPAGGVGPYTYVWSPSAQTTATATNLTAQSYTVTITDANGCTATASVTVTQPTAVATTVSMIPVSCNGGNNGTATATPSGGVGPYTYSWNPSAQTTATATNLTAQVYTVTVTDANGCTATASVTITQPTALSATTSFTQATCNMSNGGASVTVSGGVGPYTYLWTPGNATTATITNIAANLYTVVYTDANGCTGTATVNVPNAASPSVTITSTTNVSCFGGNNGSAVTSVTGGTAPYTYAWSPIGGTGSTGTNLTAQSYTVTVTDANGCSATATTTITEPPALTATASMTPVVCNGGSTGSATTTASGGVGPYTYVWSPSAQTTATTTNLTAQSYTVTITDANGCTITASVTVTEPTAVTTTASVTPVACNGGNDGTATASPSGGVGPYTYMWMPSMQTTATATNLTAQSYTVTITDANGCTTTASVTITEPTALAATTSFTQATCNMANGSASVSVTGGVGPFTYVWTPGNATTSAITNVVANLYTVVYSDANGCTGTATVNIPNAASPSITITSTTNVSCFGGNNGSAVTNVTGGTGPYTYAWSPIGGTGSTGTNLAAQNYTVVVTDANGCTASATTSITQPPILTVTASMSPVVCNGGSTGSATVTPTGGVGPYTYAWNPSAQTTAIATNLSAQSYTVTVTDANGCSTTASVTVTQPTAVTASASMTPVLCNGGTSGTATATPGGGIGPYTYSWNPSAQTTQIATGLSAQAYTVTVTDANGCSITASVTITEPTALVATTSFTQSTCGQANGSASVLVTGGTGACTYVWSPGGQTTATATNLLAQLYTVVYTDANNCTGSATVNVTNAGSPTITITSVSNVTCFGGNDGSAVTTTSGGTAPYTYAWSPIGGSGSTGTNLTAQNYTVTVTDANGCTATATTTITEPPVVTATATSIDVACFGGTTGSATAVGAGGVGPYTYAWSSGGTNATESGLSIGTYTCTVTDANTCTVTVTVQISEPPALTSTISGVDILCAGGNNGSATVTPSGGVGPYTYLWTPGPQMTQTATSLVAGNYSCDITDFNGCSITMTIAITEPGAMGATTSFTQSTCGQSNGLAAVACTLGVQPYTYLWSPLGGTGATTVGVPSGNYTCLITDANGCTLTATVNVPNAASPTATIGPPTMVSCFGGTNGEAIVTPSGGTGPYSYAWSNADTDSIAGNLGAGNYNVTVTDANGCTATTTVLITEPNLINIQASASPNTICEGASSTITATAGGGVAPFQYDWTNPAMQGQTQIVTPLTTTTYTVLVTDANMCTATAPVLVTVNPLPVPALSANTTSGCATLCVDFSDLTTIGAGSITGWSWDFGDGNTSTSQNPLNHCYTDAGIYTVSLTVTSAAGCTQTITMSNYIEVFANPIADFGASPQPTTILNPEICFTDSSTLADSWTWNFGDIIPSSSTDQNPCFTYQDPDCYLVTLTVESVDGCTDIDTQTVCIAPDVSIYVPNTFTPDGNDLNDIFIPVTIGMDPDRYELWIFDRWGNLIWYTDEIDEGWDGRVLGGSEIVQIDTYVWKLKAVDLLGNQHNLIGHVNVIK